MVYKGGLGCVRVRVCMCGVNVYVCVSVVVSIRRDGGPSVTIRAIVYRPPARSVDRSIVCGINV